MKIFRFLIIVYISILNVVLLSVDLFILLIRPRLLTSFIIISLSALLSRPKVKNKFANLMVSKKNNFSSLSFVYGETPIVSSLFIFLLSKMSRNSRFIDIGCGYGRTLLAAKILGCEVSGIDINQHYLDIAKQQLNRNNIFIANQNAEEISCKDYTHIFIAWTTWPQLTRNKIVKHLLSASVGTKIIVLTWPILEDGFTLISKKIMLFTWGFAHVWIYEKK